MSTKIIENFLKDGAINPALNRTQKGFYSVFASWILEDDLPFTTGETSGIKILFKYLILDANDSNDDVSNNGLFQVVEPKDGEEVLEKSSALKKVHTLGLFFLVVCLANILYNYELLSLKLAHPHNNVASFKTLFLGNQ